MKNLKILGKKLVKCNVCVDTFNKNWDVNIHIKTLQIVGEKY